jgi:hypothetical protein
VLDRRVPDGPWSALVTLRSGLLENSTRATITFPATRARSSPYPIVVGLLIVLLVGIASALLITRRRRKSAGF